MCRLFEAIENEGIEKGIEKGIYALISQLRKLKMEDDEICSCLMEEFSVTPQEARSYVTIKR